MLVVWGSYALKKIFKDLAILNFCGFCNFHGEMQCLTTARLAHFCFIPLFVFAREYFLICPNCGNAIKISKKDFKSIKNGTWQPPTANEDLHVLNQNELFEKRVTLHINAVINAQRKNLENPDKQDAASDKVRKTFEKQYGNNEIVRTMVENALSDAVNK